MEIAQYVQSDVAVGRKGRKVLVFDINGEYTDYRTIDYDVTEALTLGLVGRQDAYESGDSEAGMGLTAAYDLGSGFLKGGVARAPAGESLVGVSVGFEF